MTAILRMHAVLPDGQEFQVSTPVTELEPAGDEVPLRMRVAIDDMLRKAHEREQVCLLLKAVLMQGGPLTESGIVVTILREEES